MIHITDISFTRNRKGSIKPLKTLWKSTMGVQSPSTLATVAWKSHWRVYSGLPNYKLWIKQKLC